MRNTLPKIILTFLLFCPLILFSKDAEMAGQGTRKMPINYINQVIFKGAGKLKIIQGDEMQLFVEGEESLINEIKLKLLQGVLKITAKSRSYPEKMSSINYVLTVKDLVKVNLNGSVETIMDNFVTKNLTVEVDGSPTLSMGIKGDQLIVIANGDPRIELIGQIDRQVIELQGAGTYRALSLKTRETDLSLIGSGTAYVQGGEELSVIINGSGKVYYEGSPKEFSQKISGSGYIQQMN